MFWLLKKIFAIGVLIALGYLALQINIAGRPMKEYLKEFYEAPLVQEGIRQVKETVMGYLQKDVGKKPAPSMPPENSQGKVPGKTQSPMESVTDQERNELDQIIQKQSH